MIRRAEVLAIGDELVHGSGIDTNSAWLSRRIEALGIALPRFTVVGDDQRELEDALREACARADLVLTTGGLGPTEDDRTRHALAAAKGVELAFDERSWEWIRAYFAQRGRRLLDDNRRQALVPAGAEPLENRWGTAPGIRIEIGNALVFSLPGVPSEMRAMFEGHVVPAIEARFGGELAPLAHHTLRVLGPTEAALGARLEDLMRPGGAAEVGITAHFGMLSVRIAARGADPAAAAARATEVAAIVRARVAEELVYEGDESLQERVVHELCARGATLATAESCTGGMVAKMLTDVAGSSAVFPGGFVTYSNARKQEDLGVPAAVLEESGAVSEPVARAMAEGVLRRVRADLAVAITGIAGPDGGSEEKPVGTVWFGICAGGETVAWRRQIPPIGRAFVRERAAFEALAAVLRWLDTGALPRG